MQTKDDENINLIYEGKLDRLIARTKGVGAFFNPKPGFDRVESYRQAKLNSVIEEFRNNLYNLFGSDYATKLNISDLDNKLKSIMINYKSGKKAEPTQQPTPESVPTATPEAEAAPTTAPAATAATAAPIATPTQQAPAEEQPQSLTKQEIRKINPNVGLLNKNQLRKLKTKMQTNPRVQKRIEQITGKKTINPRTRYDHKQYMAIKKLIGEEIDLTIDNAVSIIDGKIQTL